MKKFMMIAALGMAALFTACGDDSSSNASSNGGSSKTQLDVKVVVSCDVIRTAGGISNHSCYAIAADDAGVDAFKTKCAPMSELDNRQFTIGAGCAQGTNACNTPEGQVEYFYDDASAHFSCADLGGHSLQ